MSWIVEVEVGMDESSAAEARDFYTRAIAELVTLDRVSDVDFWGEIRRGPVFFAVAVDEPKMLIAAGIGIAAIRTAIHAAGGATPNWPTSDDLDPDWADDGIWVINFNSTSQKPRELQPA